MISFRQIGFIAILLQLMPACSPKQTAPLPEIQTAKSLEGLKAAVACAHPEAARIGADILARGGNAIDAAIAIQWALAVCFPEAGNLGGGGFMVVREANGTCHSLDFRETAPALAHNDMYLDSTGYVIAGLSLHTHLSSGVPGTVHGLYKAHIRLGRLPMDSLIAPAIRLASRGFPLTEVQAKNLNKHHNDFLQSNEAPVAFVKTTGVWTAGDTFLQPELAETLRRISSLGLKEFYEGQTASMLIDEMKKGKGLIDTDDLRNYRSVWREPFTFPFGKYQVITMGPPASGGVAIAQITAMYRDCIESTLPHNGSAYIHALVEMQRRAYADRACYMGDPDYVHIPVQALTDSTYLRLRMDSFQWGKATPSSDISHGALTDSYSYETLETTHLSVVDSEGNAVAVTTTLNGLYGSKIVVTGAGFLLNNEMDDFSAKPGVANMFGLIGGSANAIEPGKRMLSSMTPTIVEDQGKLFLVCGSPGGATIITSVLQTILNTALYGMSLTDAVAAPKFHSQWQPDVIYMEEGRFGETLCDSLRAMGHDIKFLPSLGRVDAVMAAPDGTFEAVGDPRSDNHASGYR